MKGPSTIVVAFISIAALAYALSGCRGKAEGPREAVSEQSALEGDSDPAVGQAEASPEPDSTPPPAPVERFTPGPIYLAEGIDQVEDPELSPDPVYRYFTFAFNGHEYLVPNVEDHGGSARVLDFDKDSDMGPDTFVAEGVGILPLGEGEFLVILSLSMFEGSTTSLLFVDDRSGKVRWERNILAPGALYDESLTATEDGFLYYAGGATIGKLALRTGREEWSHKGLYVQPLIPEKTASDFRVGPGHYGDFEKPRFEGGLVLFEEDMGEDIFEYLKAYKRWTLVVDRETGEILETRKHFEYPQAE